jgi:hypothetical protein
LLLLLHGAVGNLDELLACAAGIALVLIIIFVVELLAKRKETPGAESATSFPHSTELDAAQVNPEPQTTNPKS